MNYGPYSVSISCENDVNKRFIYGEVLSLKESEIRHLAISRL